MKYSFTRSLPALFLSFTLVSGQASYVFAETNDAVMDDFGNAVADSNGNCVRTMWQNYDDTCAVEQENEVVQDVEVKRDVVVKFMRMDERIAYFDFDRYQLTDSEKAKLQIAANVLREHNVQSVKIIGYTDRIGSDAYNYKLSEKRAQEVRDYLNSLVQLQSSIVEVKGFGKTKQLVECNDKEKAKLINCLGANRRVEIAIDYLDVAQK